MRWDARIWPWELELAPSLREGCRGIIDWDLCAPGDRSLYRKWGKDALVAFYPLRVLSDRAGPLMDEAEANGSTFLALARRDPGAASCPPALGVDERACDACGREARTLLRCARCGLAKYCSRRCQADAWKGHRDECGNKGK